MIAIIQAHKNGEIIEFSYKDSDHINWETVEVMDFDFSMYNYRLPKQSLYQYAYKNIHGNIYGSNNFYSSHEEAQRLLHDMTVLGPILGSRIELP